VLAQQQSGLKASLFAFRWQRFSHHLPRKNAGIERACEAPLAKSASRGIST
jgi:hypothetical protein